MQSEEILLNLDIKCRVSIFNAQGSRPIIVVVQVGLVKTYGGAQGKGNTRWNSVY